MRPQRYSLPEFEVAVSLVKFAMIRLGVSPLSVEVHTERDGPEYWAEVTNPDGSSYLYGPDGHAFSAYVRTDENTRYGAVLLLVSEIESYVLRTGMTGERD